MDLHLVLYASARIRRLLHIRLQNLSNTPVLQPLTVRVSRDDSLSNSHLEVPHPVRV